MQEQMKVMLEDAKVWTEPNYYRVWEAAKQFRPDLILTGITTLSELLAVGQKLRVPVVTACTLPIFPTSEWAPVTAVAKPLPIGFLNSLAQWITFKGTPPPTACACARHCHTLTLVCVAMAVVHARQCCGRSSRAISTSSERRWGCPSRRATSLMPRLSSASTARRYTLELLPAAALVQVWSSHRQ
jgi:hypothetical protein